MTSRLTFRPPHSYYLADHNGRRRRVPSVSGFLVKDWSDYAVRQVAGYAVDNWARLADLPPAERLEDIKGSRWAKRDAAAATGTAIHAMAERLIAGEPVDVPADLAPTVQGLATWWDAAGLRRIAAEAMVWSDDDPWLDVGAYAGRLDLLAERDGYVWLLDIKTGAVGYPEQAVQLCAYAGADYIVRADGEDEPMPRVDHLALLQVKPAGTTLHLLNGEDRVAADERWHLLRQLRAVGEPSFQQAHGSTT